MKISQKIMVAALTATAFAPLAAQADAISVPPQPALALASGPWLNGATTTLAAQKGKVVVLLFWTRDCINCKHNLGHWNGWAKKYNSTDVAVLSVHTPETRFERASAATVRFAREHDLRFPVLVDNRSRVWNISGVRSWPTGILIDKQGRIRAEFAGELNWENSGEYKTVGRQTEALHAEG